MKGRLSTKECQLGLLLTSHQQSQKPEGRGMISSVCWEKIIVKKNFTSSDTIKKKIEGKVKIFQTKEVNKQNRWFITRWSPLNKILHDVLQAGEKWSIKEDLKYKKELWTNALF